LGEKSLVRPKMKAEIEFRDYDIVTGNYNALHKAPAT